MKFKFLTALVPIVIYCQCTFGMSASNSNFYAVIDTSIVSCEQIVNHVQVRGGIVRHFLSSNEIVGWIGDNDSSVFDHALGVRVTFSSDGNAGSSDGGTNLNVWQAFQNAKDGKKALEDNSTLSANPVGKCGFERVGRANARFNDATSIGPANATYTSYLIGKVAVAMILMESGPTGDFDWTTQQEDDAIGEAILAFDELSVQAEARGIDLTWSYEIYRDVPTNSEPIKADKLYPDQSLTGWDFGWMDDALEFLGMPDGEWDGAFQLATRLRHDHKSDYAFALYLIQEGPNFPYFLDGYEGYGKIVGDLTSTIDIRAPFTVCTRTYGNVVHRLHYLILHEVAHVFGAMDEYSGADQCNETNDCETTGGYLRYENQNCSFCGPSDNCFMTQNASSWPSICNSTLGHIGWVNEFDSDNNPDPIDPNSGYWASIFPVSSGDLVRFWTLSGDFIDAVSVTDKSSDSEVGSGFIVWDGRNYDNVQVSPLNTFYFTVNGGGANVFAMNNGNNSIKPIFSSTGYWFDDTLRFKLGVSFAYVKIELFDSVGNLYGRPVWNELMAQSSTYIRRVDLSTLPRGSYTATFQGWRPDGGLSDPYSISFIQYTCGDINNDSKVNIGDATQLLAHIFSGALIPDPIERADADGDGSVNIGDSSYMMARIFGSGPAPVCSGFQN